MQRGKAPTHSFGDKASIYYNGRLWRENSSLQLTPVRGAIRSGAVSRHCINPLCRPSPVCVPLHKEQRCCGQHLEPNTSRNQER